MCVTSIIADPNFGHRLRAAMTRDQRETFEIGQAALERELTATKIVPYTQFLQRKSEQSRGAAPCA